MTVPGTGPEADGPPARTLVWISGASAGIGAALAASVPYDDALVVDVSRRGGGSARGRYRHFAADLADPAGWEDVGRHFADLARGFTGERVVFVHNAGTIAPIGPPQQVDPAAYTRSVLLNSAAPQVLGAAFLRAVAGLDCARHLVMLSSGAARTTYPGWSAYGAGKAAVEQWVRAVGAEPNGCQVLSVAPGVVDTAMQGEVRAADEGAFPAVHRFRGLHDDGRLISPAEAAAGIWSLFDRELPSGSTVDLRDLPPLP